MDLLPTTEQEEILATVRTVLADTFDTSTLGEREGADESTDADVWRSFGELGWFGLGVAEEEGGVGYGPVEEALLFECLGEAAAPGPFVAQVAAVHLAVGAGRTDLRDGVLAGDIRAGWVEGTLGTGESLARHATGAGVFVHAVAPGLGLIEAAQVTIGDRRPALDPFTPVCTVTITTPQEPAECAASLRTTLLVAAQAAGVAGGTAAQSTSYAKDRLQFGQPIGSFQAVKHRCADMATRAEVARQQVRWAALALAGGRADAAAHVEAARVVAVGAAITNSQVNVQNHGGIGFTWEHRAHHYVAAAQILARTLGDQRTHRNALLVCPTPG